MFTGNINNGLLYRFTLNEARDNILINDTSLGNVSTLADNQVDETTENQPLIFGQGFVGITDLYVGPDGYLHVLSYTGALYRIMPLSESNTPKNQPDLADQSETQGVDSVPVVIAGIKGARSYSSNQLELNQAKQ
jgi:aldose sugar dehydrogenase